MKKYFITLGVIQFITALGAIPAGIGYLMDTSGKAMGTTPDLLADSPFQSFLIPGLFLLIVNGIGNATGSVFSFTKNAVAGPLGIALGLVLSAWIVLQVYWIGLSSVLQPAFLLVGIVETILGWKIFRGKSN